MVPTTAGGRGPQLGGKGQLPGAGSLAHSESQGKEGRRSHLPGVPQRQGTDRPRVAEGPSAPSPPAVALGCDGEHGMRGERPRATSPSRFSGLPPLAASGPPEGRSPRDRLGLLRV